MKQYYRIMLGRGSKYAEECWAGGFIGVDFDIDRDLSDELSEDWRVFNKRLIPVYLQNHPEKSKIAAGLACGTTWTVAKGLNVGDIVISPNGQNGYFVGEISGDYYYQENEILPHRRPVFWAQRIIDKEEMSEGLKLAASVPGTSSDLSNHKIEIERLILLQTIDIPSIGEDSADEIFPFPLEAHLEEFMVKNWEKIPFGQEYQIYETEDGLMGRQLPTDAGTIDLLAVSNDRRKLLVVELKRGRPSDKVVGQILRYIGFVKEELAEENQEVRGIIVGFEDDPKMNWALKTTPHIEFYKYQISFKLFKG